MAVFNPSSRRAARALPVCALLALAPPMAAELPAPERAFAWSADVLSSDFRSDTLDLSGNVRVTQGPMLIEAGAATARDFRAPRSRWTFRDAVHIRTDEADLKANSASATFVDGRINAARVEGSPAVFEQINAGSDAQVRGRAESIEYDFAAGLVKLNQGVWFTNGKDEFRGDVVIYDVRDERVEINPGGQSPGRVRGIIRPRERTEAEAEPQAEAASSTDSSGDALEADRARDQHSESGA